MTYALNIENVITIDKNHKQEDKTTEICIKNK